MQNKKEIQIDKKGVFVCPSRCQSIKCLSGALWVTYKNGKDIILKPGEETSIKRKRRVIIQCIESGTVELLHT